jgi:polyisoprenoid-binding protein YceI
MIFKLVAAACLLASATGFASSVKLDTTNTAVKFSALGRPSLLNITGTATGVDGSVSQAGGDVVGDIKFKLEKLVTGIETRDEHMKKKYLEVEKFPNAELAITSFHLPPEFLKNKNFEQKGIPFKGDLTLHGTKKAVEGIVDLTRTANAFDGVTKIPIKMSDFNISTPKFAGIEVKDDVQLEVDVKGNVID